jgi:hypothetical protein
VVTFLIASISLIAVVIAVGALCRGEKPCPVVAARRRGRALRAGVAVSALAGALVACGPTDAPSTSVSPSTSSVAPTDSGAAASPTATASPTPALSSGAGAASVSAPTQTQTPASVPAAPAAVAPAPVQQQASVPSPPPGDGTYTNVDGNQIPRPVQAASTPNGATAKCNDGTWSFSQHRSGTCSGHGGVAQWL